MRHPPPAASPLALLLLLTSCGKGPPPLVMPEVVKGDTKKVQALLKRGRRSMRRTRKG